MLNNNCFYIPPIWKEHWLPGISIMLLKQLLMSMLFLFLFGCTRQQVNQYFANKRLECDRKAVDLPSIYMDISPEMLDSIHKSQSIKIDAEAKFITVKYDTLFEGEVKIKTRGNFSFYGAKNRNKKSYNITFPYKQFFFGLYPDKSYSLIANGVDGSKYMCNVLAFDLARAIGLPTPKTIHLHLYTNNQYKGIYQLTNKVAAHPEYLPLHDLSKDNKWANTTSPKYSPTFSIDKNGTYAYRKGVQLEYNPEDITGGYLLDHSYGPAYEKSPSGFYSNYGLPVRIREPKYASEAEVNYIADFFNQMEEAVCSPDGYNIHWGKHYSQYLDIESFAKYYLIQELLVHNDAGAGSFIMYKNSDDIDSLMYAGPVWDFDAFARDFSFINALYASEKIGTDANREGLLYYLCQHPDFREKAKEIYVQELYPAINELFARNYFDSLQTLLVLNDPDFSQFVRLRSDFLYWLWTADSTDIVQLKLYNTENVRGMARTYNRTIVSFYGNKIDGVRLPTFSYIHSEDPIPENYYLCDSDIPLPIDTIFHSNQSIKIHWRKPSRYEVIWRQIKKILHYLK